jgi:hypothetical protein
MSTTGNPSLPPAKPEAMAVLLSPPPTTREGVIEQGVKTWRTIGSPGFPFDEARIRERAGLMYDRCFYPQGPARQIAAIMTGGSRKEALAKVKVPALVIAEAIRDAELLVIEGMGHDLPTEAWPRIVAAISALTERAEKERA